MCDFEKNMYRRQKHKAESVLTDVGFPPTIWWYNSCPSMRNYVLLACIIQAQYNWFRMCNKETPGIAQGPLSCSQTTRPCSLLPFYVVVLLRRVFELTFSSLAFLPPWCYTLSADWEITRWYRARESGNKEETICRNCTKIRLIFGALAQLVGRGTCTYAPSARKQGYNNL